MWKERISPGERVTLKLTPTEIKAILEDLMCLDREYKQLIQEAPAGKPVMMTLDDLEDFCGYVAAEANHTDDKRLGRKLDRVFDKCQRLLETYTDDPGDAITADQAKQKLTKGINDSQPGKEPGTVRSEICTSRYKQQWAGRITTCTNSPSKVSLMVRRCQMTSASVTKGKTSQRSG